MPTKNYQCSAFLHPRDAMDHRVSTGVAWVPRDTLEVLILGIAPQHTDWSVDQIEQATRHALDEVEAINEHPFALVDREGVDCYAMCGYDLAGVVRAAQRWFRVNRAA